MIEKCQKDSFVLHIHQNWFHVKPDNLSEKFEGQSC